MSSMDRLKIAVDSFDTVCLGLLDVLKNPITKKPGIFSSAVPSPLEKPEQAMIDCIRDLRKYMIFAVQFRPELNKKVSSLPPAPSHINELKTKLDSSPIAPSSLTHKSMIGGFLESFQVTLRKIKLNAFAPCLTYERVKTFMQEGKFTSEGKPDVLFYENIKRNVEDLLKTIKPSETDEQIISKFSGSPDDSKLKELESRLEALKVGTSRRKSRRHGKKAKKTRKVRRM